MSYVLAVLIVAAAAAAAGVASWFLNRFIGAQGRRQHHEVSGQVFSQVGIMFSVLLSFVFSEVWSEYNIAAQAVSHECGALHGAAMLAGALAKADGHPIEAAIYKYGRTVVAVEWPLMARRERSPRAATALRDALDQAVALHPADGADLATRNQIVALLLEAHANRETRTFQITAGLPLAIWIVLLAMALVLDGFLLLAGTEIRSHIFLAAAAAGSTAAALVLLRMLDFPFEGALALQKTDFVKMTNEVFAILAAP